MNIQFIGSVVFITQPQKTTVTEGSDVRFQCSFEGSVRIPDWKINTTVYYWQYIPRPFTFHPSDFSLSVENVTTSYNGTTFQCIIPGEAASSVGLLIVKRAIVCASSIITLPYFSHINITMASISASHSTTSKYSAGKLQMGYSGYL